MELPLPKYLGSRIDVLKTICADTMFLNVVSTITDTLYDCIKAGGRIISIGNGGSCAQAQHFTAELVGRFGSNVRKPLPAISLTADTAVITAISNDYGYEQCFSRQVESFATSNDVLVAFTTSGKSKNIIEALQTAKNINCKTVVFCGCNNTSIDGFSDLCIKISTNDVAIIQECHLTISHFICESLSNRFNEKKSFWEMFMKRVPADIDYLILDRDGVINTKKANGYIKSFQEFVFKEGFLKHIAEISQTFKRIFVVTNQKGVGLSLMTLDDLKSVHSYMLACISSVGGRIDRVYFSTAVADDAEDRKPNIGLAKQIKVDYPEVDFCKSLVVGDSASDQLFANRIGAKFIRVTDG